MGVANTNRREVFWEGWGRPPQRPSLVTLPFQSSLKPRVCVYQLFLFYFDLLYHTLDLIYSFIYLYYIYIIFILYYIYIIVISGFNTVFFNSSPTVATFSPVFSPQSPLLSFLRSPGAFKQPILVRIQSQHEEINEIVPQTTGSDTHRLWPTIYQPPRPWSPYFTLYSI